MSYNFMMIHANVQSVGDYTGKTPSWWRYDNQDLPVASKRMTTLIVNQLMTNWGRDQTLSLDAGASYNIVKGNEPDHESTT